MKTILAEMTSAKIDGDIERKLHDPQFEGQTKTKLSNTKFAVVDTVCYEAWAYLEENPAIARRIVEKAIRAAQARELRKARS